MKRISFKNQKETFYIEPIEGNPRPIDAQRPLIGSGYLFRITKGDGDIVGCVAFYISMLTNSIWANVNKKDYGDINKEQMFMAIMPYLPFDRELVNELYAENQCKCFKYIFNSQEEGLADTGSEYKIKVENSFYETAQRLIFGGYPNNVQIRRRILELLYDLWQENSEVHMRINTLLQFMPVDKNALTRNIRFLVEDEWIKITSSTDREIVSVKITNKGIKLVEDKSEFNQKFPTEITMTKIMGDSIKVTTHGNASPAIVKSKDVNLVFTEIKKELGERKADNKQELTNLVEQLEKEIKTGKDPSKIKEIMGKIGKSASWVNKKLLSHPVVSQIIATFLSKEAGIL